MLLEVESGSEKNKINFSLGSEHDIRHGPSPRVY